MQFIKKEYNKSITLLVNESEITVPLHIVDKELKTDAKITLQLIFEGDAYIGIGRDLDWCDAFADLQKKLPNNVFLKCCMACRHGNLCPYGNIPDLILCTLPKNINTKDDLVDFLSLDESKGCERESTFACDHFEFANNHDYTYNDFLYYLEH